MEKIMELIIFIVKGNLNDFFKTKKITDIFFSTLLQLLSSTYDLNEWAYNSDNKFNYIYFSIGKLVKLMKYKNAILFEVANEYIESDNIDKIQIGILFSTLIFDLNINIDSSNQLIK